MLRVTDSIADAHRDDGKRFVVHDNESPATHPSAAPVVRTTAGTLSLVFILDGIIPSAIVTANPQVNSLMFDASE